MKRLRPNKCVNSALAFALACLVAFAPINTALAASGSPGAAATGAPPAASPGPDATETRQPDSSGIPPPSPSPIPTPTPEPVAWVNLSLEGQELEVLKDGSFGDSVLLLQMRLRALGYFSYKVTGQYGRVTVNAVKAFQAEHKLKVDGVAGFETLSLMYSNLAKRGSVNRTASTPTPTPKPVAKPSPGTLIEWSKAKSLLKVHSTATLIDFQTGYSWKIWRLGGDNHMDVEPYSAKDTATFKQAVGHWSWSRRPALLKIGSRTYACSINSMPHSPMRINNNNYPGHHCVHFLNSRTHGTNSKDPDHQRCVQIAAGKR